MLGKIFPKNEHVIDRLARVVAGLLLLSLVVVGPQTLWGLVGLLPLATGLIGSCPAYTLLGVGTCRRVETKPAAAKKCCCGGEG
jgi:hypothetical protein